jgi:hypothetical protein
MHTRRSFVTAAVFATPAALLRPSLAIAGGQAPTLSPVQAQMQAAMRHATEDLSATPPRTSQALSTLEATLSMWIAYAKETKRADTFARELRRFSLADLNAKATQPVDPIVYRALVAGQYLLPIEEMLLVVGRARVRDERRRQAALQLVAFQQCSPETQEDCRRIGNSKRAVGASLAAATVACFLCPECIVTCGLAIE